MKKPSGSSGTSRCQAVTAPVASDHGQLAKKYETGRAGCVRSTKCGDDAEVPAAAAAAGPEEVALWLASHVRCRPSAVTIPSETTLSAVVPNAREANPTPPPSASPAMPTVGQEPVGIARPRRASAAYDVDQPRARADRDRAVRVQRDAVIRFRSTTSPVVVEYPA